MNRDKIINMIEALTNEDLAEMLQIVFKCRSCPIFEYCNEGVPRTCKDTIKAYLEEKEV